MTMFPELARSAAEIAERSGNSYANMTADDLGRMSTSLKLAAMAQTAVLQHRCNGNTDRASLEIRRALSLPAKVLIRRAGEAEKVVNLDGMPSVPQCAAMIARMMATIQTIDAEIERRGDDFAA